VVNMTHVFSHTAVNLTSVKAGKHIYTEKPIATTVEEADAIITEAEKSGCKLACAPPFLLNPAISQAKQVVSDGMIGKVCFARGHGSHAGIETIEGWPTDSTWFIKKGAGPFFDLGVYALTVLTGILGPARRVAAFSGIAIPERRVHGGETKGTIFKTEAHDNTLALLDFGDSVFASVDATFCVRAVKGAAYEFYGSEGDLAICRSSGSNFWFEAYIDKENSPNRGWLTSQYNPFPNWRITLPTPRAQWEKWEISSGVIHLIDCILEDRRPAITGEHARHIVEIITKAYRAAETGASQELSTSF
jgi:predicted dehydrogenase